MLGQSSIVVFDGRTVMNVMPGHAGARTAVAINADLVDEDVARAMYEHARLTAASVT